MNFVPYAIPLFIVAMLVEFVYARKQGNHQYRLNDTVASLAMGTLSRLRAVIQIGLGAAAYEWLVASSLFQIETTSWLAWVVAFVIYDLCYYFSHRYGHEWRLLWASHVAHHQSEEFNLSTALRQTSTGGLSSIFYLPMYIIGFPAEMLISVGSLNLIYQFWVHTEHVRRLGILDYILVTPSNHRVHHAKNPCYVDRNYGGVFILWDRLFGTFEDERESEPCVYGITHQLSSFNPLWANAHVYKDGLVATWQAPRWRDKLRLWFKGPGWWPEGVHVEPHDWRAAKYDPIAPSSWKFYAFAQFWVGVIATFSLLPYADSLATWQALALALAIALGFYTQGVFLEGRHYARTVELARLGATALLTWSLTNVLTQSVSIALYAYCAVCAVVVLSLSKQASLEQTELPIVANHTREL